MRVLIAGSSGLLGSALTSTLTDAGHDVRRLVRRAAGPGEFRWDPSAGTVADGVFEGVDAVVNFCGASLIGLWSAAKKQQLRDSRIEPTEVLADAVATYGIPTLINASAVGYYGNTGEDPVDESAGAGSGFLAELCRDWEAATKPAADAGARVVLLRTGLVLSRRGGLLGPLLPLFKLGLGGKLGAGGQYMPWIHVDDHAAAVTFLLESDVRGPVNVCGPRPATNAEFTAALANAVHRPALLRVPTTPLRLVLGDAADEMALASQNAVPRALSDAGFSFRHKELDDALHQVVSAS